VPSFLQMLASANTAKDWESVLAWEYRIEELLAAAHLDERVDILQGFSLAHHTNRDFAKEARYEERKVAILGGMQLFRDQGTAMCEVASALRCAGDMAGFRTWLKKARALGDAHGFFEVEATNPAPCTLNPTPYTLNPKPYTLSPKPYTLSPKPQALTQANSCHQLGLQVLFPRTWKPCRALHALHALMERSRFLHFVPAPPPRPCS